jgi:hypothetical protein
MKNDLRGQRVANQTFNENNQYHAGRDIVQGDQHNYVASAKEVAQLLQLFRDAAPESGLDAGAIIDVTETLKEVEAEAKQPNPDKSKLLGYLDKTKEIAGKMAGATESVAKFTNAFNKLYESLGGIGG